MSVLSHSELKKPIFVERKGNFGMEFLPLVLQPFPMSRRGTKRKWLAVPLAALFLLFSTGAAAAPDCHVESAAQPIGQSAAVHNHSAHQHVHLSQITASALLNSQESLRSMGSILNNEICIAVGFIVLLLLRFSRMKRSMLIVKKFSLLSYQLPSLVPKNLSYLNLTHLKLGIIRI